MKKKVLIISICILLIGLVTPPAESFKNIRINTTLQNPFQTTEADFWTEAQKLLTSNSTAGDAFGFSVSLSGDTALIGAYQDDDNGDRSGSAYVFTRIGTTWTRQQKLLASDGATWDHFGCCVSLDGDTALIAAAYDDDHGEGSGSVYVFTRSGTTWTEQQKLTASDGTSDDYFGYSVFLSCDTALIGACGDNENGFLSGSAYVFTRTGTIWTEQAKLLASDGEEYDVFGRSVSLYEDTALISAVYDDDNGNYSGSAYVFIRAGTTWTEQAKLLASDGTAYDNFGYSVSIEGDTALIGAGWDDDNGNAAGSAYVFTRSGITWTQQQKLIASEGVDGLFGWSVSLSGDTALIGAHGDNENGVDSGAAYVFTRINTTWAQQTKLLASDGAMDDFFGWSVSLDGDTALSGVCGDDDNGTESGSMYVFTRNDTTWTEQGKLLGLDDTSEDRFGCSVSIDGDTALIGAYRDDNGKGSAYIFTRTGSIWTQQAKLLASDGAVQDFFGISVSLSGDTALIGAPVYENNGSGSAYVFIRTGTTWTQQAKLVASDGAIGDVFGLSVSLFGDTAIIGAPADDDHGSAYIFTRTRTTWTQQQKLFASDAEEFDAFGVSVSLLGDTALIGAPYDYDNGNESGSAYVFTRSGNNWTQEEKLLASDGAAEDWIGRSVSLDRDTALIGAYGDDNHRGSAYVFTRTGTTWIQQAKLLASDGATWDHFGESVSLDGDTVLIGADWNGDNGFNSGSAYVFTRSNTTWIEQQKLLASDGVAQDYFGFSVSLAGDTAFIGAYNDDDNGIDSGSVYVFSKVGLTFSIAGGLGVKVRITNNGPKDVTDIIWKIHVAGGIFGLINKTVNGTIDIIAGESKNIGTGRFFGCGPITIIVKIANVEKSAEGIQFFIFSIVKVPFPWT